MYLYLGQDTVVSTDDIIGIFDLENTSMSGLTRAFLAGAQKSGQIVEVSAELPKSFVVCGSGSRRARGKAGVYLSQISPSTLKKRAGYLRDLSLSD